MPNILAVQDADGRPIVGQGYDPLTHQFVAPQAGQAVNDATTNTPYAGLVLAPQNTGLPTINPLIVQKAGGVSAASGTVLTQAFAANVTAGNSIVVVCGTGNGGAITVTDSLSNTYKSAAAQIYTANAFETQIFFAVNTPGGANTVTVTNVGSASMAVEIYEVSGLIQQVNAQPDQFTSAIGSSAAPAVAALAASSPNSLIFAGIGIGTGVVTAFIAGTGLTNDSGLLAPASPAGLFNFVSLSGFLASTAPLVPAAAWTTSRTWAMAAAIFKPVVVGIEGTVTIDGYNYTRVTTAATTLVKTGPGTLHAIIVNTPTATATIEPDDALTNTTPIIGKLLMPTTAANPFTVVYDVKFNTGLASR